jgi:hypothetical protein
LFIGEVCVGFWLGNLRESSAFEDLGVDGRMILKWILKKLFRRAWTGLIWLRTGRSGTLL